MSDRMFVVDALESRRLLSAATSAASAIGVNFNDESLWDSNFATSVQQAKNLGVQSVRLWMGFDSYDDRPNAYDPVPAYGSDPSNPTAGSIARTMARAFQLKRDGFSVEVVLQNGHGAAPTSASQAQGFIQHMLAATETKTSTQTLKDVVSVWEVGNEPDVGGYWAPSQTNKTTGLKSYVDSWLVPAAATLHAAGATVMSAGIDYSPADLKIVVDEIKAKKATGNIDIIGFHPYGTYDPKNPSAGDQIHDRTIAAKAIADGIGKPMMATEWNVRGFGVYGANDANWAKAIDYVYKNDIAPYYIGNYYFSLVNNFDARGGATSARPGGLLKHNGSAKVTTSSSIADQVKYYNSPLIASDPFYSTFASWQWGTVAGKVTNTGSAAAVARASVFIDLNNNGVLDASEPTTLTDSTGAYSLKYSTTAVTAGTYTLRVVAPAGTTAVAGTASVGLKNLTTLSGVNFTIKPNGTTPPVVTTGTLAGTLFQDDNADGLQGAAEAGLEGWTVYLDLNNNGVADANEPAALTNAAGTFAIAYDTSVIGTTPVPLKAVLQGAYVATTAAPLVTPAANGSQSGLTLGVYVPTTTPVDPPVTDPSTASVSGVLFNDGDGNGLYDGTNAPSGSKVVFLDTNGNGKLDAGEIQTTSDANGVFTFSGLLAGTYHVTRVFPSGYHLSNGDANGSGGTGPDVTVTLTAAQALTGVNIGTTNVTTPPVVTPPVTPPVTDPKTASISGVLFNDGDGNGLNDGTNSPAAGKVVFIDANGNGKLDTGETQTTSAADGSFTFSGLAAGTYRVARVFPTGYHQSNGTGGVLVTVTAGQAATGADLGTTNVTTSTPPPVVTPPVVTPPAAGTASFTGTLYGVGASKPAFLALGWNVFLDANNNGKRDAGEIYVAASTSSGAFNLTGLAAGKYTLAVEPKTGWKVTTPSTKTFVVTLKAGQAKTDENFVITKA